MGFEITAYVGVQSVSALVSLFATVVAWRRRRAPGGLLFALMMSAVTIWTVSAVLEEGAAELASKILFSKISDFGQVSAAPLFMLFAMRYHGRARRIPVLAALLWVIPASMLALVATNALHGLTWTSVTPADSLGRDLAVYTHGPAWWFFAAYNLVLALMGSTILLSLTRGRILALSPIAREALVEAMPDGLVVEDASGRVVDANPRALTLLGKDSSVFGSALGRALDRWPQLAAVVADGGESASGEILRRDDRWFQLDIHALQAPRGYRLGRMIFLRDVTRRREAEDSSSESERDLRSLLQSAQRQAKELELLDQVRTSLASSELDLSEIFRTVVEGIARAFGYTQVSIYILEDGELTVRHQVGYSNVIRKIPPSRGITGRVFRTGVPVLLANVRDDPDFIGAMEGVVSEVCIPLFDRGAPVGVLNVESIGGVAMGPEDLRLMSVLGEHVSIALAKARLYAEARENEERYRTLVAALGEGVAIVDASEHFEFANPAAEAIFGVPPGGLAGKSLADFMSEEEFSRSLAETKRRRRGESSTYEQEIRRPDGETRQIELVATPRRAPGGEVSGTLGIFRDVTELRRLQEQLQQSQKMEAVGRLAGGIAHDFNNILTVITGYCEMALEESRGNRTLQGSLEEIKRAARRSATLVSQLLAFSRRQILLPRVFDLAELVEGMGGMLRRLLGEDVRLVTTRGEASLDVNADPGRIEQVIMNLAVNSRDAMPGGGLLTIETRAAPLSAEELIGHPEVAPGEYVGLSVRDTGHGMDAQTMSRLFEPFFTTKEVGKGTGLGLAMVYGIVRQSSGHITCHSEVGRGTTFTVYLPRVDRRSAGMEAVDAGTARGVRGTGRILLVEDDESVRRYVRSILESAGYTVIAAESGHDALERLGSLPEPPHLLLTDVVMPGMDGRVLSQQVALHLPGIPVVFMSGYADIVLGVPGLTDSDSVLIQKPFSSDELLQKIHSSMQRREKGD